MTGSWLPIEQVIQEGETQGEATLAGIAQSQKDLLPFLLSSFGHRALLVYCGKELQESVNIRSRGILRDMDTQVTPSAHSPLC